MVGLSSRALLAEQIKRVQAEERKYQTELSTAERKVKQCTKQLEQLAITKEELQGFQQQLGQQEFAALSSPTASLKRTAQDAEHDFEDDVSSLQYQSLSRSDEYLIDRWWTLRVTSILVQGIPGAGTEKAGQVGQTKQTQQDLHTTSSCSIKTAIHSSRLARGTRRSLQRGFSESVSNDRIRSPRELGGAPLLCLWL